MKMTDSRVVGRIALVIIVLPLCFDFTVGTPSAKAIAKKKSIQEIEHDAYVKEKQLRRHKIITGSGHMKAPVEKISRVTRVEVATLNLGTRSERFYQGDIQLPPSANSRLTSNKNRKTNSGTRQKRKVINANFEFYQHSRWPLAIVPYSIEPTRYSPAAQRVVVYLVRQALDEWEKITCLKFLPANNYTAAIVNHNRSILIYSGQSCSSVVGYMDQDDQQYMSLSEGGCLYKGVIMHEFGHALGMIHEQSRPDRDGYITILHNNVDRNYHGDFKKNEYPSYVLPSPYDISSVMHYGITDYSANSKATIAPNSLPLATLAGYRGGASFYDGLAVNSLYECSDGCSLNCKNDGYSRKLTNGSCVCVCPYGIGGTLCDTTDASQFACGGVIMLPANGFPHRLTSPNFPNNYNTGVKCSWIVKAPAGFVVKMVFTDFNLTASPHECKHFVEVRANLIGQQAPSLKCGIGFPGDVTSRISSIVVLFDASQTKAPASSGFAAHLSTHRDGCMGDPCRGAPCTPDPTTMNYTCQLSTANFICGFENMVAPSCSSVKIASPYNKYNPGAVTRKWDIVSSTDPAASEGSFYMASSASDHGQTISNGSFSIIPFQFHGSSRCLKFKYYTNSDNAGFLKVYRAVNGALGTPIFNVSGNQGDIWNAAVLEIAGSSSPQDLIEIVFESYHYTDVTDSSLIGIDDLRYFAGPCAKGPCASDPCGSNACAVINAKTHRCTPTHLFANRDLSCSFEDWEDCSEWIHYLVSGDSLDWQPYPWRGVGSTWERPTGPMGPATGLKYLYGKMYDAKPGNTIWLRIRTPHVALTCLQFKYSMFGADVGTLSVYRSANRVYPGTKLWSISGDQGPVWRNAALTINSATITSANVELTLEVVRGNGFASDYGLDDVTYKRGPCA